MCGRAGGFLDRPPNRKHKQLKNTYINHCLQNTHINQNATEMENNGIEIDKLSQC